MIGRVRCLVGRHDWHPHPDFTAISVRECRRCLRAESSIFTGRYVHRPHVERERP